MRQQRQRVFVMEYLSGGAWAAEGGIGPQEAAVLQAQGRAMRDAMVADLAGAPGLHVTAADGGDAPPALQAPGLQWVRPHPQERVHDFVRRQAAAHDLCWIVAPETGGLLGCLRKIVGRARWVGCDSAAIRLATSKRDTLEHLARHGLPTPLDFARAGGSGRWVVKPDDGAGCCHTRVHEALPAAQADLRARQRRGEPAALEPWVDGAALSLSLLCRPGGAAAELLGVNRQRVQPLPDGTLRYDGVSHGAIAPGDARFDALARLAQRLAQALPGLQGYAGIDLVWHPVAGPVVIEVNPRLTCAFVGLSERLRRPLGREIVALFAPPQAGDTAAGKETAHVGRGH